MKTTIDIPDQALADAMRFTGAKTKREAVVKALEGYNRQQRVNDLIAISARWISRAMTRSRQETLRRSH